MTAKLWFWLYAWVVTMNILGSAVYGVRQAQKDDLFAHRRWMNISCWLVALFVVSYVFKVVFLGKEDLNTWKDSYVIVLRIHELFIGIMLFAGGMGRWLAHRFRDSLAATQVDEPTAAMRRRHTVLGKITLLAASAALITASFLIYGMLERAQIV